MKDVDQDQESKNGAILANAVIEIKYYINYQGSSKSIRSDRVEIIKEKKRKLLFAGPPEYTHQLFENEEISFLSPSSLISLSNCSSPLLRIDIAIDQQLRHWISFPCWLDQIEKELLLSSIKPALPSDSIVIDKNGKEQPLLNAGSGECKVCERKEVISPREAVEFSAMALPGKEVYSFEKSGRRYSVRLASSDDSAASVLLQRAEKVAMWYIETADSIDFQSDPRWEVLLLFRVDEEDGDNTTTTTTTINSTTANPCNTGGNSGQDNPSSRSSDSTAGREVFLFAGYMTLFTFNNPIFGAKLRICQALLLPPFQQRGLGLVLLQQCYRIGMEREGVAEINVEDPAPVFKRLRDKNDFLWLLQNTHHISADAADGPLQRCKALREELFREFHVALPTARTEIALLRVEQNRDGREVIVLDENSRSSAAAYDPVTTVNSRDCSNRRTPSLDNYVRKLALAKKLAEKIKIIPAQCLFLLEVLEYFDILNEMNVEQNQQQWKNVTLTSQPPEIMSKMDFLESNPDFVFLRKCVKRRLLQTKREKLNAIESKYDLQQQLATLFQDEELPRFIAMEKSGVETGLLLPSVLAM